MFFEKTFSVLTLILIPEPGIAGHAEAINNDIEEVPISLVLVMSLAIGTCKPIRLAFNEHDLVRFKN